MTDTLDTAARRGDAPDADVFARDWADWHAAHETVRADAHGFLAVTALHWLGAEPTRFDGVPGEWSTDETGTRVVLADGDDLRLDGQPLTGTHDFGVIPVGGGVNLTSGDVVVELADRGGRKLLRPRDPANPYLAAYEGTPAFPADPAWAVPGRFVPAPDGERVTVGSAAEGLEHVYEVPGTLEFELDGRPQRLTAFNGGAPGSFFVVFADATSGVSTYAANRSLSVPAPDADGNVVIDFNRAVNLPCAYTDHATCPLPPGGNRLAVAVEAGERTPPSRQH